MAGRRVGLPHAALAALLGLGAVLTAPAAQAQRSGDPCPNGSGRAAAAEVPSRPHPTLQSAVCAVADGGRVFIRPGTYDTRATIWGKKVQIIGIGRDGDPSSWPTLRAPAPQGVAPAERAQGTLTVAARGSLVLRRVSLEGGDAGIVVHDRDGPANALDVEYARFRHSSRGILFLSGAALSVNFATFEQVIHNAISVYVPGECTKDITVSNSIFIDIANVAVLIRDCHNVAASESLLLGLVLKAVHNVGSGGILAVNSGPLTLSDLSISTARAFGVAAIGSSVLVQDTLIEGTVPLSNGQFGDGIISAALPAPVGPATVIISNSVINSTARAGASSFGSFLALQNTTIGQAGFDLSGEQYLGYDYEVVNAGGVTCVNPPRPCRLDSVGLEPPGPVDVPINA